MLLFNQLQAESSNHFVPYAIPELEHFSKKKPKKQPNSFTETQSHFSKILHKYFYLLI